MSIRLRSLMLVLPLLGACAHTPADDPSDPFEPVNRAVFSFNLKADKYVAKPVAKGYVKVVPQPVRVSITNFFNNLGYPTVIINDILQAKFVQGGRDTGRFLFNTTVGLGGLVDAASLIGLEMHDEDFGQTFGTWGVGPGWYLMLPLLGPSSNRDLTGRIADTGVSPLTYVEGDEVTVSLTLLDIIDTRARLLGADSILDQQFDPYIFVRSAYLQRRQNLVYDGNPPKEVYDFGE